MFYLTFMWTGKVIVWQFEKYIYLLSGGELDEDIETT